MISPPMARPLPVLVLLLPLLLTLACSDRDAPRPVPVPGATADATHPLSSREPVAPAPAAADPDDPAEPGISDLARLARYVFKAMQRHEEVCPFGNPFRERLQFALAVEVKAGRMARVGLGRVDVEPESGGSARTLAEAQWPRELTGYLACLAPHLQAVAMSPAPADGPYEPEYGFSGWARGRAAP